MTRDEKIKEQVGQLEREIGKLGLVRPGLRSILWQMLLLQKETLAAIGALKD